MRLREDLKDSFAALVPGAKQMSKTSICSASVEHLKWTSSTEQLTFSAQSLIRSAIPVKSSQANKSNINHLAP